MRILVVEDDTKIASFVVKGLTQAGFAVDLASDGEEGSNLALAVQLPMVLIALPVLLTILKAPQAQFAAERHG